MNIAEVSLTRETLSLSKGVWNGTRIYAVRFADLDFDPHDAMTADDGAVVIPLVGQAWRAGHTATVIGMTASTTEDQLQVDVTVTYSSESSAQEQAIENPVDRVPAFDYGAR